MSAFGNPLICNLCVAEGKGPFLTYAEDNVFDIIELHTRTEHPEHVKFLADGGIYRPLIPSPMGGNA